jgi:hypothetical protein
MTIITLYHGASDKIVVPTFGLNFELAKLKIGE